MIDYVVYKLTFPNGKIYIGKDIGANGHSLRYFGSWFNTYVESDFTEAELRDFTIRKEIIFESKDKAEVSRKESEYIVSMNSNDPAIGYNQTHRRSKITM
ncbi:MULTISPECIES: hypothetical protein [Methylotenera]|uniref:hypothetical protein n=1 Tax=Methylotenera TaxID=359407 RepID=UPI00037B60F1|nr:MULTISPECIES: hypothetical protein [Methylotenera]